MAFSEIPKSILQTAQSGRDYADSLANKYIVKPKSLIGINGFVFDQEIETKTELKSTITDHFIETNEIVNDHIANLPFKITLRGFVAEVAIKKETGILGALEGLQSGLSIVPAYLGEYTPDQIQILQNVVSKTQQTLNLIDNYLARAKNLVNIFDKSSPAITKQEKAFQQLKSMSFTKEIFAVETPFGVFERMAIETLVSIQDDTTKYISDFSVTLKQLNFAEVEETTFNKEKFAGRAQQQKQDIVDQGKSKGIQTDKSILLGGLGTVGAFLQ